MRSPLTWRRQIANSVWTVCTRIGTLRTARRTARTQERDLRTSTRTSRTGMAFVRTWVRERAGPVRKVPNPGRAGRPAGQTLCTLVRTARTPGRSVRP
jgi:hypothetical protein